MSWALFHTPQSSVQLSHNPAVMNDTKQEWFWYLCLIIRNLKLVFQREIDSETLLCPTMRIWANVGNPSSCQDSFSIIYRNTLKSLVLLTARGSHGPQLFQDENIPLLTEVWPWSMSRELSFCPYFGTYLLSSIQSLFWLMDSFSFWQVLQNHSDTITMPHPCFAAFHVSLHVT